MVSITIAKEVDRTCISLSSKRFAKINGNTKVTIIANIKREVLCRVLNTLNFCFLNRIPPTIIDIPLAKSRLTRTAPVMEEMTIVFSPLLNAKNEIIISAALPNVALSNPPAVGPTTTLRLSVERLM